MKSAMIKFALSASTAMTFISPALAQSAAGDDNGGLAEIIVTAQKREQSVQDVPIAVTAITQEALQANRIVSVNDLSSIAPGVTVRPSPGGVGIPTFTVRGQSSYGVVPGSDKQVSIYLDGVYIASPRGSIFDLPDVARIEVLRGPQGTLFGRNATAGAISVSTRDPSGDAQVKLEGSYGNYDAYRLRASVSTPEFGPFSAYFSFMRNYKRGDIQNAAAGQITDRTLSPSVYGTVTTSPAYLGTTDSNSYFAALKFESGDFKLVYKFDRTDDKGTPDGVALVGVAGLLGTIITGVGVNNNLYMNPGNQRPNIVTNGFTNARVQHVIGHSATATWRASDSITVKNIFAYRHSNIFAADALDGFGGVPFLAGAVPAYANFLQLAAGLPAGTAAFVANSNVGRRFIGYYSHAGSDSRQTSDELQINYSSDRLQATLGALYFHSKDESGGPVGMQGSGALLFLPASGQFPLGNEARTFNKATSLAAYAQLEFKLTDQLELVGGARVTSDTKDAVFRWDLRSAATGVITSQPNIIPPTYKKTKPNFLIGLNWKPNADTLVYAKWSNSFVTGGSTVGIDYEPETASSFEAGVKADFLDHKLRTNLALFYVDYKHFGQPASPTSPAAADYARAILGPKLGVATAAALVPNIGTFLIDVGNVRAKGFELEVTAAPSRGLTMGAGLGYTDTSFPFVQPLWLGLNNGEYLPTQRPKWTGSVYGSYETQPVFGEATMLLRLDGIYRSSYLITSKPVQDAAATSPLAGVPGGIRTRPNFNINGRVALRHIQFGQVEAELALWGKNITDNKPGISAINFGFLASFNYEPARTFGAELSVTF